MAKIENFAGSILIEYKKHSENKIGVMVAIDSDTIGWSLCKKEDIFDKKVGLNIAIGRAMYVSDLSKEEKNIYYQNIPSSLKELFKKMTYRSHSYFKIT